MHRVHEFAPAAPAAPEHGGDLDAARRRFPDAPEPWIDLSTGINRAPYPVGPISPAAWETLPTRDAVASLEAAAHAAYGAAPSTAMVAAAGTQALIQWLPRLFPAHSVGILGFTYEEHARVWRAAGATVTIVPALTDLAAHDIAIVVNPNNPDGTLVPPSRLADLARDGRRLIVDEAFMDVIAPSQSLIPCLPGSALVLRSFGKTYGLGGLRLGFAAADATNAALLRTALGPWPVAGPAIEIGSRALRDTAWLATTIERLRRDAARLDELLASTGFTIVGATPLFRLAHNNNAQSWFLQLGRAGILTRRFQEHPTWLRFGLPHGCPEWRRLKSALLK